MFIAMQKLIVLLLPVFLLSGCATIYAPSAYKFEPKVNEEFGIVIISNESTDILSIRIDNEFLVFHSGKKDGPSFGQGPYDCEPKEKMELKMTPGIHKLKWNLKDSSSGSSAKFEVFDNKKIKIIIPTAKLFGLLEIGFGTSTKIKIEEINTKTEKIENKKDSSVQQEYIYCPQCGANIKASNNFCTNCGYKLTKKDK